MSGSISLSITCLLALTLSLHSAKVPSLQKLTPFFVIEQALSNNNILQELIKAELEFTKPESERELSKLPIERIEELKQALLDTYKWPLIDLFKDYSVKMMQNGNISLIAFSSDGTKVLTGSDEGPALLWDLTTQQPTFIELQRHAGRITSVAFSPDGRYALTGPWLWDLVEPMASLTLAQLLIILKLKQNSQDITNQSYRAIYEKFKPEIKTYLKQTLNLQL
jgi:WD40 repeat protein